MGQGRFGVVTEVLQPLDRRVKNFTKDIVSHAINTMPTNNGILELARQYQLLTEIHCVEDNRHVWEHLPVNAGDVIFKFVEGIE